MPPPYPTKQVTIDGQAMESNGKLVEGVRSTQLLPPSAVMKIFPGPGNRLVGGDAKL
jgi:hypothetical protein